MLSIAVRVRRWLPAVAVPGLGLLLVLVHLAHWPALDEIAAQIVLVILGVLAALLWAQVPSA